ncbi:biotin synthase BioB [Coraliomargarita akajimensis]|uniref:Biotin synthase n=1 Tax=Coraliomargarita akajimensis (strain DSM 45221 / IAM 15411 / JCM 23193 / KCTC 12865 / 04OKA010-24) TaxID=583355 RepID=D5EPQ2_CORAD|nr:biotin synthase BioB [Coraliomargarita akajimensis]ADE53789.1 biotin synthase [Coraliomargarita akajimensis DSM 45221]
MAVTLESAQAIYELPLTTLIFRAQQAHHEFQDPAGVQLSMLQSIKTGACSEDCKYCAQSSRYTTFVDREPLMDPAEVRVAAIKAKASGASRFCMGAAWRGVSNERQFKSVLESVRIVDELKMEVCCTLGLVTEEQAKRLKDAGMTVYNHNLDTSREYYSEVISTRSYDDRLETIANVRKAGLEVCSGGIVGMGESDDDRLKLLVELANLEPQPESVPINALVAVEGTPMCDQTPVDPIEFVRLIATARILMPRSTVRLSAGRTSMSEETQALCFLAGANSIFIGNKLLTTANPEASDDEKMLERFGLHPLDPAVAREKQGRRPVQKAEVSAEATASR